jgi:pimeloyl-ACP methyl ester carboxylesterase
MKSLFVLIIILLSAVVAFVTLRWLTKSREDTEWEDAEWTGKVVDVRGVPLHYVESGNGRGKAKKPTLVMVHGFGGHTYSFRNQMAAFSGMHRCVALDLKGFGFSGRVPGDHSLTEQARIVLGTMDALGIGKGTLIGHSMGGEVVVRAAEIAPERVEKLILVASVSGERPRAFRPVKFLRPFLPGMSRLIAKRTWRRSFFDPSLSEVVSSREAYMEPVRIRGSMDGLWEMWRDVPNDPPVDYARVTMPVLVLWAEQERIIPFPGRTLGKIQNDLPQAQVVTIPRSGHLLLEENPEGANAAIREFLTAQRREAEQAAGVPIATN